MARVRVQTYADYAWPPALGALYRRNGLTLSLALAAGLALFLVLAVARNGIAAGTPPAGGNFYAVFPHDLMVALFAPVFVFAVLALAIGVRRFWRAVAAARFDVGRRRRRSHAQRAAAQVPRRRPRRRLQRRRRPLHAGAPALPSLHVLRLHAVLRRRPAWRRCTTTCSGWRAPYELASLPVLLGIAGGIGLLVGLRRLAVAEPAAPPAARRPGPAADGPRLHRAAVPHQRHRPGADAGPARHRRAGAAARACTSAW